MIIKILHFSGHLMFFRILHFINEFNSMDLQICKHHLTIHILIQIHVEDIGIFIDLIQCIMKL